MTERKRELPSFDRLALRQHGDGEAADRVWKRLSRSVADVEHFAAQPRSRRRGVAWSLAMAAVTFGAGIGIGRQWSEPSDGAVAQLSAEPAQAAGRAPVQRLVEERPAERSHADEDGTDEAQESSEHVGSKRGAKTTVIATPMQTGLPEAASSALPSLEQPDDERPEAASEPALGATDDREPPSWQRLANGGEYEAALFDLAQAGGFESVFDGASAEQLMLLADVARATGQRQRAISALRKVLERFPADPVAPLAAWSLGRALENAGDKRGASEAFAAYRALSPEGDFAEDALVRQLRSAVQRSERELAEQLAEQYARDFPNGRHRDETAHWMAQLQHMAAGQEDAGAGEPEDETVDVELEAN